MSKDLCDTSVQQTIQYLQVHQQNYSRESPQAFIVVEIQLEVQHEYPKNCHPLE